MISVLCKWLLGSLIRGLNIDGLLTVHDLDRTEDMQSLGTSDYMGSAHWRSANNNEEDPDDAYPFVSCSVPSSKEV